MTDKDVKPFLVPDLGEGLTEATLTGWSVAVGDTVELNQTLCTLETNKAEVEIPSPYAGQVLELGGAQGDTLDVGALLIRIAVPLGQERSDEGNGSLGQERSEKPRNSTADGNAVRAPVLVGYGADGDMDASRRPRRPRAAPAVRKLAADLHVELAGIQPSGPGGVITREDVLAAAGGSDEVAAVVGVRAQMAERMSLSRRTIPDAHASVQVDCTALLELREKLSAAGSDVSAFVLTLRLLTVALGRHPVLNSTWVDAEGPQVHFHRSINLGIAAATERGLLVPVISDAQNLTTRQLAERMAELIGRARDGSAKPADLQGSTFTVSNFGALGIDEGVPVINYPEAAILGIGSLKPRAVVVDGAVVARPTMTLTCVFDHRVADGAQAAEFLGALRDLVESPETALIDL